MAGGSVSKWHTSQSSGTVDGSSNISRNEPLVAKRPIYHETGLWCFSLLCIDTNVSRGAHAHTCRTQTLSSVHTDNLELSCWMQERCKDLRLCKVISLTTRDTIPRGTQEVRAGVSQEMSDSYGSSRLLLSPW